MLVLLVIIVEPALRPINLLHLLLGFSVDSNVDKNHNKKRDVEGDDRRCNSICSVSDKVTAAGVIVAVLSLGACISPPMHHDGQEGHQGRNGPDNTDNDLGTSFRHEALVAEGRSNGQITVNCNDAQGLYACCHTQDIH